MAAPAFEIFEGQTDGSWYWRLVGANGEKVAQSEAYTRAADARRAVTDVMRMFRENDVEVRDIV